MQEFIHVKLGKPLEFSELIEVSDTQGIRDSREAAEILIILIGEAEVIFVQLVLLVESDGQGIENQILMGESHIVRVE
jgi:hypothetical protein